MHSTYDMIVIGAGISGLSMAFEAKQAGLNVIVLEKEPHAGGCFYSAQMPNIHSPSLDQDINQTPTTMSQPFWLEMGTHTCFNSYGRLLHLLRRLDMMDQLLPREKLRYRLWRDQCLCFIPSQLHFGELITHAWRIFALKKQHKSIADYYTSLVGGRNYHDVFQHAFAAVLCQPASDVPADMLFRKRPRDKSITRSYTFAGGLSDVIHALEKTLDIQKDQQIQSIGYEDSGDGRYAVSTTDTVYHAKFLVCATPALAASRLLHDVHTDIADQLAWVNEVEIESVAVAIDAAALSVEAIAGVIAVDGAFYSAVSRDYLAHPSLRGFTFHFKPGLRSKEEKIQCICDVLKLDATDLQFVVHHTNRLPAPDMGHHALTDALDAALVDMPLALIGNYFDGVAVEDCLERVEKELARLTASL